MRLQTTMAIVSSWRGVIDLWVFNDRCRRWRWQRRTMSTPRTRGRHSDRFWWSPTASPAGCCCCCCCHCSDVRHGWLMLRAPRCRPDSALSLQPTPEAGMPTPGSDSPATDTLSAYASATDDNGLDASERASDWDRWADGDWRKWCAVVLVPHQAEWLTREIPENSGNSFAKYRVLCVARWTRRLAIAISLMATAVWKRLQKLQSWNRIVHKYMHKIKPMNIKNNKP